MISSTQQGSVSQQWETSLHCNDVSHWLGAYLDWSLPQWVFLMEIPTLPRISITIKAAAWACISDSKTSRTCCATDRPLSLCARLLFYTGPDAYTMQLNGIIFTGGIGGCHDDNFCFHLWRFPPFFFEGGFFFYEHPMSVCPSACLSVRLTVCMFICLSVTLFALTENWKNINFAGWHDIFQCHLSNCEVTRAKKLSETCRIRISVRYQNAWKEWSEIWHDDVS